MSTTPRCEWGNTFQVHDTALMLQTVRNRSFPPVMRPSLVKRSPVDILQELVNSILFPLHKGRSESFAKWNGPHWSSVREQNSWLASRQNLEGAEGLWRIDDGIYDLRDFVEKHPGGREWIEISQGTDITEMFKSHHVSDIPRQMLSQFYVRNAKTTRNSPFTFHPKGFYEVLRRRISDKTKNLTRGPSLKSKAFADLLFIMTVFTCVTTTRTGNYIFALAAGVLLSFTTICAHNFFHQRDHWRRYYFQLSGLSVKGWRVSHAMSHHMFPNSQHDLEVAMFEPWLHWLPKEETPFWRYISWSYSPIVYTLIFPIALLVSYNEVGRKTIKVRNKLPFNEELSTTLWLSLSTQLVAECLSRWGVTGHDGLPELLPLVVPAAMVLGSGFSVEASLSAMYWWIVILLVASFMFGLIGLNAGHHHPELFHDGDIVKSHERMDWGVYQMLTVKDRVEVRENILGLVSFGDHCLHHLFPSLDHATLPSLYPELRKTCQEFGLELGGCSLWEAIRGQFLQLARVHKLDFTSRHQ